MTSPTCPWCGEPAETFADAGGGEHQEYVEDCAVCCRPIRYTVRWDDQAREYEVWVAREE